MYRSVSFVCNWCRSDLVATFDPACPTAAVTQVVLLQDQLDVAAVKDGLVDVQLKL